MHISTIISQVDRIVSAKILDLEVGEPYGLSGFLPSLPALLPAILGLRVIEDVGAAIEPRQSLDGSSALAVRGT